MSQPLVSIVITAFNVAEYLPETLRSVFAQTYGRRDVIIVDDGSTDDFVGAVQEFADAVTIVRQDNAGLGAARNRGLERVNGDFVAFLDADDLWEPDALTRQLDVAERHADAGLVVCDGVEFGRPGGLDRLVYGPLREVAEGTENQEVVIDAYPMLLRYPSLVCPAQVLYRRAVVDALGPVSTDRSSTPDYDYNLRAAQRFPMAVHLDRLVRYRYRSDSLSGPIGRRQLLGEQLVLTVLATHRPACRPDEAAYLDRRLIEESDRVAASAYHYGVREDRPYAKEVLRALRRIRPRHPSVRLAAISLAAPAAMDPLMQKIVHATRVLHRRCRRKLRRS